MTPLSSVVVVQLKSLKSNFSAVGADDLLDGLSDVARQPTIYGGDLNAAMTVMLETIEQTGVHIRRVGERIVAKINKVFNDVSNYYDAAVEKLLFLLLLSSLPLPPASCLYFCFASVHMYVRQKLFGCANISSAAG